jgi:hypothetical protein
MRARLLWLAFIATAACSCGAAPTSQSAATASGSRGESATSTPITLTTAASYARTQPGPTASNPGSISGLVNCACGGLPAQDVYAISTDGARFYVTQTVPGQAHWRILGVPVGQYFVYAAERIARTEAGTYPSPPRFASGYTKAIACGLTVYCTDHSPVVVEVRPGQETPGAETFDWYADDFPLVPVAGLPPPVVSAPPAKFPTAKEAAVYLGLLATEARYVAAAADCPVNLACYWLESSHTGTGASYYIATAGANNQLTSCSLYLIASGGGWQTFDGRCGVSAAFPAVGAPGMVRLGMGETGCVNVHDSPSLSGRVVACLSGGTAVQIDDGPVYAPTGSTDLATQYWWHIAGAGWMVHQYLA